jgi:2-oxo-4-hydroxy-4-carboxy-5-ureidoimidazoline decarboxylase
MRINELNEFSREAAYEWFFHTCASENWCNSMINLRPFYSRDNLIDAAQQQWNKLHDKDFLEAFLGHPMIGNLSTLQDKFKDTHTLASDEQSSTQNANENVLQELYEYNQAYLSKHGFIFIMCATGHSAEFMLQELKKRIGNSTKDEIINAAQQQILITLLRIQKGITQGGEKNE